VEAVAVNAVPNPFRWQARIRFIDTDASGRIHYTCLFRYFESAEVEFLRTFGMTYETKLPYAFPRVHVQCHYRMAIVYDDLLTIEVSIGRIGNSSVRFDFRVLKEGELAAHGSVVAVCTHRQTERPVPIPDAIRQPLLAAQEAQQAPLA
jgi:YbgC/YbaW family acyl-CoA thioester hydrolase